MVTSVIMQRGITSLHLASFKGHKEVVELLLDRGANMDKADEVRVIMVKHSLS